MVRHSGSGGGIVPVGSAAMCRLRGVSDSERPGPGTAAGAPKDPMGVQRMQVTTTAARATATSSYLPGFDSVRY